MDDDQIVSRFCQKVRQALEASGLKPNCRLVVAVSGGPDSLALLYALHRAAPNMGMSLHGAHLNHSLRGDASDVDAGFVADTFRSLSIPLTSEKIDVASYRQEHRLSLEEAARRVRLDFLARVMAKQAAGAVAVGHTHDDQAETVLQHLIRGSGLTGLRGMQPTATLQIADTSVTLVRPMLDITRAETEEFCRAIGVEPRVDESNQSHEMTRNRVRLELLPIMERINPSVKDALVRLSRSVALDLALIEREVSEAAGSVVHHNADGATIERAAFSRLDLSIQRHLLRRTVGAVQSGTGDLTERHVNAMLKLMPGPAGKSVDLPGGVHFAVSYDEAYVRLEQPDGYIAVDMGVETPLRIPGETVAGSWRVTATVEETGSTSGAQYARDPIPGGELVEHFDAESLSGPVTVRNRRPGDTFQALGMKGTKKLQDFMVDLRIPRDRRDGIPLVVSDQGIAWVAGVRIAEWARVRENTRQLLRIEIRPTEDSVRPIETTGEAT